MPSEEPSDEFGYAFTNTMVPVWRTVCGVMITGFPETQYASSVSTPAADRVSTLFALALLPVVGGAKRHHREPPVFWTLAAQLHLDAFSQLTSAWPSA